MPERTCRDVSEFAQAVRFISGRSVVPETRRFVERAA